ncbi:MAG TPA: TIGR00159 family protein [Firmicutes bacterium]|nr:TIGR00159 family protein [Candidatus Fermentithermobacillaceae bacterium]
MVFYKRVKGRGKQLLLSELRYLTWQDILLSVVDIAIVAYLFYRVFVLIRGTRAVQLMKGIAVLFVLVAVTRYMRLYTLNWLLEWVRDSLWVALPIVFQPELRRALEQMGRGSLFARSVLGGGSMTSERIVDEIVDAAAALSASRTGALMVITREAGLQEYIEDAQRLDALVTSELLQNIFVKNTPLHDGAVVIKGDRIAAAACFLPSTEEAVAVELGSRHRAALGITQVSDAIAVVVSEETGTVSLAVGGRLFRGLDKRTLKEKMMGLLETHLSIPNILNRGSAR